MLLKLRRTLYALALTGLIAGPATAGGEGWTEDFEGAKKTAASEGKDMLLDFTGSDWCSWCIKLKEEVFVKDAFKSYANENFVLVELDYPNNKKQPKEIVEQNEKLKDFYKIQGYPTILLTDAKGLPYAKTGYQRGGPDAYVAHLKELTKIRQERDDLFAAAKQAKGADKAKLLDEALQKVGMDLALTHYESTIDKIIASDADNEAGLKQKYQEMALLEQQRAQLKKIVSEAGRDGNAAVKGIDKMLEQDDLLPGARQEALAFQSQIMMFMLKDKENAKKTLQAAIDADPESKLAEQLRSAMKRFFSAES